MSATNVILVVDDDRAFRSRLEDRIACPAAVNVHGASRDTEAENLARLLRPSIVLFSFDHLPPAGERVFTKLREVLPAAEFIAYSASQDASHRARALLLGADQFAEGREGPAEAVEALLAPLARTAGNQRDTVAPGNVIAVAGLKGGVGRTTVAANLAVALAARAPGRVLLVDLVPHTTGVAQSLGLAGGRSPRELASCLAGLDAHAIRSAAVVHRSGVHVLAGGGGFGAFLPARPSAIRALLRRAAADFDYVVVDTPGAFDDATGAALRAAGRVLVVTDGQLASLRGAGLLVQHLAVEARPGREVRVVLNHTCDRPGVGRADALRALEVETASEVPFDPMMPRCVAMGRPLVLHNPAAPAAEALVSLANWAATTPRRGAMVIRAERTCDAPRLRRTPAAVTARTLVTNSHRRY